MVVEAATRLSRKRSFVEKACSPVRAYGALMAPFSQNPFPIPFAETGH
jgi:hypothetical protein